MTNYNCYEQLKIANLKHYDIKTIEINSAALAQNPLNDATIRQNPVLVPKEKSTKKWPVVLVLAGFTGSGQKYFNYKPFEETFADVVDHCTHNGAAPRALYVFVDSMTYWGGSQFINSKGCGRHEDSIVKELVPVIKNQFPVDDSAKRWCVMGGSSGGYGALHLVSKFPEIFGYAAAIAPDSFFEMSLIPEILTAMPVIEKMGGINAVKEEINIGKFFRRRDSHTILNAIGMAACYSGNKVESIKWPVDKFGKIKKDIWKTWQKHDPIHFLNDRKNNLKRVKGIFLDVGTRDQFYLQYGTRQINEILKKHKVNVRYSEFDGNHFDISDRRPEVWGWLKKIWG